jgi:hypothetical protein
MCDCLSLGVRVTHPRNHEWVPGTRRRSGLPGDIADGDGLDAALGDQQLGGGYRS